jgi:hypothetical protein
VTVMTAEHWAACSDAECPKPHIVDAYSTRRHLRTTTPAGPWSWLSDRRRARRRERPVKPAAPPARRLELGRLSVYVEPRDLWVGVFIAPLAVYVCPLPMLVFRWARARR